jgi:cyclopropane fatty-acyl-phospholipid synthase-like methyltransferase
MSQVFENYARRAESPLSFTSRSGRYRCQQDGEKRAIVDIASKLALAPTDNLLDIGCGAGNLTIPLSFLVHSTTGVDHPRVVEALRERLTDGSVSVIGGSFLEIDVPGSYQKILMYGVVSCLRDVDEVARFVDKAAGLLAPGGRLLVGDIPNVDKKRRFADSPAGRRFQAEWDALMADPDNVREVEWAREHLPAAGETVQFDDAVVLGLVQRFRGNGLDVYCLPQPPDLAFGHTREDLLIERPG